MRSLQLLAMREGACDDAQKPCGCRSLCTDDHHLSPTNTAFPAVLPQKITLEVDPDGRGLLDFQEVSIAYTSLGSGQSAGVQALPQPIALEHSTAETKDTVDS